MFQAVMSLEIFTSKTGVWEVGLHLWFHHSSMQQLKFYILLRKELLAGKTYAVSTQKSLAWWRQFESSRGEGDGEGGGPC